MQQTEDKHLSKMEISDQFGKFFEDESNVLCFHCGKKSRQWAETKHAIFLCLSCAADFKEISRITNVKSISLDLWSEQQMALLKAGGNNRFKQFLQKYGFEKSDPKHLLRTKAVEYYRKLIQSEVYQTETPAEPSLVEGKQPFIYEIPLTEMTGDELAKEAKERISWVGRQSKVLGKKAYEKVHQKVTSGELKEEAKKAGEKITDTAKSIWAFISTKVDSIKKDNKDNKDKKEEKKEEEASEM